jgi:amidase
MHPGLVDDARVKSTVRREIASGLALTDDEVAAALAEEQRLRREWSRLFSSVDIALTPTSQVPPFPVGDEWVTRIDGVDLDTYTEWMRSCSRLTVPGGPSLSLPAGFTDDGLPVGIQLSAARGADLRLLGFARIAEEVLGVWPRPPIDALASMEPATLPPGPGD